MRACARLRVLALAFRMPLKMQPRTAHLGRGLWLFKVVHVPVPVRCNVLAELHRGHLPHIVVDLGRAKDLGHSHAVLCRRGRGDAREMRQGRASCGGALG